MMNVVPWNFYREPQFRTYQPVLPWLSDIGQFLQICLRIIKVRQDAILGHASFSSSYNLCFFRFLLPGTIHVLPQCKVHSRSFLGFYFLSLAPSQSCKKGEASKHAHLGFFSIGLGRKSSKQQPEKPVTHFFYFAVWNSWTIFLWHYFNYKYSSYKCIPIMPYLEKSLQTFVVMTNAISEKTWSTKSRQLVKEQSDQRIVTCRCGAI